MAIKFLNTVQVDTNVLYVDAANSNVGIGTASPNISHKLDVNGSGRFSGNITSTSNISARSFDMNSTYDSSNQYLQLHKNQSNDGGILLRSRTAAGAGQIDWQIVNQGTTGDLKFYAYGLGGNAFVLDRETGNLQLPEYGAGTLVTDASGNITASSGGGAGGPYLPLAGGTMAGTITMNNNRITSIEELRFNNGGNIGNQINTDISGLELVANVEIATYTAAFFDFVIKKTANVRSGTVYACHDGTNVEFTETSTNDLGDTSDVTLSVDISGTNMRLLADAATSGWSVKSLIRAI